MDERATDDAATAARRSRVRVGAIALSATVLAVALAALLHVWRSDARPFAAPRSASAPVALAFPPLPFSVEPSAAAPAAASPPPAAASANADAAQQRCGLPSRLVIDVQPDGSYDEAALRRALRRDEVADAVARALAADARPFAQGARLLLPLLADPPQRLLVAAGASAAASGAEATPFEQARDALARMATTTSDAAVYALAWRTCHQSRDGACALLNAQQWARLDPGNAAPWLEVLAEAQQRRDRAAADEALHRIATSARSEQDLFRFAGLVLDAAPADEALQAGTWMLTAEAMGVSAAWVLPAYQPLVAACRGAVLQDANRRQTCQSVAELLTRRSDVVIERSIGITLARQLGWPDEEIERMRAEYDGYAESMRGEREALAESLAPSAARAASASASAPDGMLRCDSLRRDLAVLRRHARLGEIGAMNEWLAHEAPPREELLRRYREARRAQAEARRAQAEAQGASALR